MTPEHLWPVGSAWRSCSGSVRRVIGHEDGKITYQKKSGAVGVETVQGWEAWIRDCKARRTK